VESRELMDAEGTELELARAREAAMARFVALAAHELRAPATVVHGVAATLATQVGDLDGEQGELLVRMLYDQSSRLVRLLDQLLDLSRLDAEAVEIERAVFTVRERVQEVVAAVAGEEAASVEVEIEDGLVTNLDPNAFDRILGNLVTNALRYGAAPVRITADQTDSHFRLLVEDRGEGVDPELQDTLFERFSSGDPAAGTGLGLAIAQSFALAHGGSIFYEPGDPGARFRVVIPAPPPA
jgi:signal transduction histidine kinase